LQEYKNTVRIVEAEKRCHHNNTEAEPRKHYSYKKKCVLSLHEFKLPHKNYYDYLVHQITEEAVPFNHTQY